MRILTPGPEQIAYTLEGPAGAPVLMFSNSLGTTMAMWEAQAGALARRYRVLRYDTRGHGASGPGCAAGSGGACTLDQLGGDALRLLDALDIERASFCGISMGGLTGLWLGVHAGHRLQRLVVANSAARIGTPQGWRERAAHVNSQGMDAVADGAAGRWFTPRFRKLAPGLVGHYVEGLRRCAPAGYAACCEALADADLRDKVKDIDAPTLIIAGLRDEVTTVEDARFICSRIADARCAELDASHLSNLEAEAEFTRCLVDFLD
ncbi:MAG: 3-oxoadipate enol-lactonase [Pseudomonadota bacterium]